VVFRNGLVTNLLNPKVVIFYLAILPQFVNPDLGRVGLQMFLLACIHNAFGVAVLLLVGAAAGGASSVVLKAGFRQMVDGLAGAIFFALAFRLLIQEPSRN
jgi:threonine/homoserine/homoserine lactone efflux protein